MNISKLALQIIKFCPYCNVIYFGAVICEPCSKTYMNKQIELIPIPLEVEEDKNGSTDKE